MEVRKISHSLCLKAAPRERPLFAVRSLARDAPTIPSLRSLSPVYRCDTRRGALLLLRTRTKILVKMWHKLNALHRRHESRGVGQSSSVLGASLSTSHITRHHHVSAALTYSDSTRKLSVPHTRVSHTFYMEARTSSVMESELGRSTTFGPFSSFCFIWGALRFAGAPQKRGAKPPSKATRREP